MERRYISLILVMLTELPNITTPKKWRGTMADNTVRVIEACGFRIEHGALVLVHPAGCAAAYAPLTRLTIEEDCPLMTP